MLHKDAPRFQEGYCAVIYHDGDTACTKALGIYRPLLRPDAPSSLLSWSLLDIITRWCQLPHPRAVREWLNAFHLRYIDLQASQPAYEHYIRNTR